MIMDGFEKFREYLLDEVLTYLDHVSDQFLEKLSE